MSIALSANRKRSGARYILSGELSRYASWVQTLELPADGDSVSISAQTVRITFRPDENDSSATLTVSTTASQISITDADTLSISVTDDSMSGLTEDQYYVDLTSNDGTNTTHWGHGVVAIRNDPVTWS